MQSRSDYPLVAKIIDGIEFEYPDYVDEKNNLQSQIIVDKLSKIKIEKLEEMVITALYYPGDDREYVTANEIEITEIISLLKYLLLSLNSDHPIRKINIYPTSFCREILDLLSRDIALRAEVIIPKIAYICPYIVPYLEFDSVEEESSWFVEAINKSRVEYKKPGYRYPDDHAFFWMTPRGWFSRISKEDRSLVKADLERHLTIQDLLIRNCDHKICDLYRDVLDSEFLKKHQDSGGKENNNYYDDVDNYPGIDSIWKY